ncbi:MAG TPA: hypothetical protein DIC64_04475 [Alphaproteobacteria bacterium]|nr:hypothetical protein [Alphaproteobacteria bacterium]
MTNKMKIAYALALIISISVFNSCTLKFFFNQTSDKEYKVTVQDKTLPDNKYGTYLAARVAHIRQNYDAAADYYMKNLKFGAENEDVLGSTYLLLASEGRIDEATEYALKARESGDKTNLIAFIAMTKYMHENNYKNAYDSVLWVADSPFKNVVLPLFQSWILAASGKNENALEILDAIKKDEGLIPLYHMQRGMLNDYFGNEKEAFEDFNVIVDDEAMPLSFRALQIIGNFYLRNGQKDKIVKVAQKYYEQNRENPMLGSLVESFKNADTQKLEKIIDSPQKGLAEAVFNVGTIFRGFQNEVAQLFTSLVLYLNPDFEVARVSMADIYEQTHRYQKATDEYLKIKPSSPVYYVAQLKAATTYMTQDKNKEAFETLSNLLKMYPKSEHITFRLGELSRVMKKYDKAIEFYQKALDELAMADKERWTIYYALGISYERQNKWQEAEDAFKKALELSNRHPFVLNYLGYSWIERGMNYNEALYMIFEAHRKNSEDGHIIDSLGWALYKMGNYENAVKVLERASEYLPSNAVVFEHLGDAYYQVGRKNEAKYQWQHALHATEDKEDLDIIAVQEKLKNGMEKQTPIPFNDELLQERLKTLDSHLN